MQNKKGQFWYSDFLIGLFILMIISVIFVVTMADINSREDVLQSLIEDGESISNSLMSEGYLASGWIDGKGRIGFVKDGKVNNGNLEQFETITDSQNYATSKYLLGTLNDYAVYFENKAGDVINNRVYGGVSSKDALDNLGVENLVKFTRFVYYDTDGDGTGELVKMIIFVWTPF